MANNRLVKIEGEFKRGLSEIFLTDIKDPRMSKMTSVTRVEITQDLKYAKVYVSIFDTDVYKRQGGQQFGCKSVYG